MHVLLLSSCTLYLWTPMCRSIYFWMNSSVCRVSACVHENNMAQFPFLWTIQLPVSGRLMERGLLDQCHRASGVPRSLCTVLLLPLPRLSPSPTYSHTHTRMHRNELHTLTLCQTYTISHQFTFIPHRFSAVSRQHTFWHLTGPSAVSLLALCRQPACGDPNITLS